MGPIGPSAPGAPGAPAGPCGPGGPISSVADETTVSVTLDEKTWPEASVTRKVATVTPSGAVSVVDLVVAKQFAPSVVQQYELAAPSGNTEPTSVMFAEPFEATTVWSGPALTVEPPFVY